MLGRLGAALIDGLNDWGGVNYLIGHWVWIGSMVVAAAGFWLLALSAVELHPAKAAGLRPREAVADSGWSGRGGGIE